MSSFFDYLCSLPQPMTALERLHNFDIEEYEEKLLLEAPLDILRDPYLTNIYVKYNLNDRIQKLVIDALIESKEELNKAAWDEVD